MIRSTTNTLQGREIEEYLGIVVGEAILGANIFKDIFGAVRDIVGGRAGAYEDELGKARDIAFQEIEEEAHAMGANAIIGIDIDYEVVGQHGGMMMVSVSGTAVRVKV
ncbi:MAG: heavy metal-binding domain-containing protein [Pseudomonadales bacterium]|nr:heavy metal-binding domain-containing protein [Pseudomonadales bacterium]